MSIVQKIHTSSQPSGSSPTTDSATHVAYPSRELGDLVSPIARIGRAREVIDPRIERGRNVSHVSATVSSGVRVAGGRDRDPGEPVNPTPPPPNSPTGGGGGGGSGPRDPDSRSSLNGAHVVPHARMLSALHSLFTGAHRVLDKPIFDALPLMDLSRIPRSVFIRNDFADVGARIALWGSVVAPYTITVAALAGLAVLGQGITFWQGVLGAAPSPFAIAVGVGFFVVSTWRRARYEDKHRREVDALAKDGAIHYFKERHGGLADAIASWNGPSSEIASAVRREVLAGVGTMRLPSGGLGTDAQVKEKADSVDRARVAGRAVATSLLERYPLLEDARRYVEEGTAQTLHDLDGVHRLSVRDFMAATDSDENRDDKQSRITPASLNTLLEYRRSPYLRRSSEVSNVLVGIATERIERRMVEFAGVEFIVAKLIEHMKSIASEPRAEVAEQLREQEKAFVEGFQEPMRDAARAECERGVREAFKGWR